jgi:hypothetical protein
VSSPGPGIGILIHDVVYVSEPKTKVYSRIDCDLDRDRFRLYVVLYVYTQRSMGAVHLVEDNIALTYSTRGL